jgi:uncharacterized protein (TIGR00661 family)
MKILYAVQKTGNGHLARAQELIPILEQYGEVDILASGTQSQLKLNKPIKYSFTGISLYYNKKGAISILNTILHFNIFRIIKEIRSVPLKDYDLVINDFEPISAWKSVFCKSNIVSVSHQSSLLHKEVPKPKVYNWLGEFILRYYAPIRRKYGFHFQNYANNIFTPIIRQEVRNLKVESRDQYLVYLPSYSNKILYKILQNLGSKWIVFSKQSVMKEKIGNCTFYPIQQDLFLKTLAKSKGVLCSAGFELPAETIYLNKKLMVVPIKNQYEQYYNAAALEQMGVCVNHSISSEKVEQWMHSETEVFRQYTNNAAFVIQKIIQETTAESTQQLVLGESN